MNKYIIIFFCVINLHGYSKERYTITQYKVDKTLLDSAYALVEIGQYEDANTVLKHYKSKIRYGKYYLQAKINYHLNKPFKAELNRAFTLGFSFIDSSDFYLENQIFIDDGIKTQLNNLNKNVANQLFEELITTDQKYRADGILPGSDLDKALLVKFDSLIAIYGWPCRSEHHFKGIGPILLLAHQDFTHQDLLMRYYYQIVDLCLENKEDWMLANFILNQRYQWFGSKLRHPEMTTDTLSFQLNKDGEFNQNYTLPFFYSMSKKLVNSTFKLEIIVSQERFKNEIRRLIYFFEEIIIIPEKVKYIMEKDGFSISVPKGLSDYRFSIEVDPDLKDNQLVYQFVNNSP